MDSINLQHRAIAYSVLAHIYDKATFANGPLDIFIPIVKNALSELYPSGTTKGSSISEITEAIDQKFSITIPFPVLNNILKTIAVEVNGKSNRDDMCIYDDGSFWIEKFIFEDYSELIQKGKDDISKVIQIYKNFCKVYNVINDCNEADLFKFIEQNRLDVSYYLANNTNEAMKTSSHNIIVAQFIDTLKQVPEVYDKIRDIYLGSMLSSYLDYQPSNVKMDVELLLDTNFIISLLDLNTPESTDTCNTLIKISRNLGYSFTILNDTIEEVQALLSYKASNYSTAIIAKNINREDIYNACDRRHLTGTDLMRISDNIENTLTNEFNFHIIPNTQNWYGKAKFSREYSIFKKYRNSEKAALHDAMALVYVRERRGNKHIKEFEKVNCWFVNNSITHDHDYEDSDYLSLYNSRDHQPEIIKVDNLLNIIWLSNPSIKLDIEDLSNMGITSLLSYTLNSSLPKARIIKELDENIQKYREDYNITDKDVINLSTRIVNRQIKDVQELNNLARRDDAAFAAKVKEESIKQEQIEANRVQKFENLVQMLHAEIKEIQGNQAKMQQKYNERLQGLDERELKIEQREKSIKIEDKALKAENEKLNMEKCKFETKLKSKWEEENKKRKQQKEDFIDSAIAKSKNKAKWTFWPVLIVLLVLLLYLCYFLKTADKEVVNSINDLWSFRPISTILTILTAIINCFTATHFYNWCFNPSYIVNKKNLIKIPKKYCPITWEEFMKTN